MPIVPVTHTVVDSYIAKFSEGVQKSLRKLRAVMKSAAPNITEGISYGIPTLYLNGKYLVYFAAFKHHLSVYPATTAAVDKVKGLVDYKVSKGTLKFSLDKPIPFDLISKFVKLRVQEQMEDIQSYNDLQTEKDKKICESLMKIINTYLHFTERKIWHAHPVWFINGNPIVGYSKQKDCVRLLFWSGADFDEKELLSGTGKFKDASIRYTSKDEIKKVDLKRWLGKSEEIQWDYKNIVKRRGQLIKLT